MPNRIDRIYRSVAPVGGQVAAKWRPVQKRVCGVCGISDQWFRCVTGFACHFISFSKDDWETISFLKLENCFLSPRMDFHLGTEIVSPFLTKFQLKKWTFIKRSKSVSEITSPTQIVIIIVAFACFKTFLTVVHLAFEDVRSLFPPQFGETLSLAVTLSSVRRGRFLHHWTCPGYGFRGKLSLTRKGLSWDLCRPQ